MGHKMERKKKAEGAQREWKRRMQAKVVNAQPGIKGSGNRGKELAQSRLDAVSVGERAAKPGYYLILKREQE